MVGDIIIIDFLCECNHLLPHFIDLLGVLLVHVPADIEFLAYAYLVVSGED
jgi:hypothetical protein